MSRRVIGIGAVDRGDDAAGIDVAKSLKNVDAVTCLGGSIDVIDLYSTDAEIDFYKFRAQGLHLLFNDGSGVEGLYPRTQTFGGCNANVSVRDPKTRSEFSRVGNTQTIKRKKRPKI